MKINKKLARLNVDFPSWEVVDEYLSHASLKKSLLEFLSEAFASYTSFRDNEKLIAHAFRILAFVGEKKVLPYIVECMRLYRPLENSFIDQEREQRKFENDSVQNSLDEKILAFLPLGTMSLTLRSR